MYQVRIGDAIKLFFLLNSISDEVKCAGNGFVEKFAEVGLSYQHRITPGHDSYKSVIMGGGMALGDVNGDGWEDIFVTTGAMVGVNGINLTPNQLLINDGQGNFTNQASGFNLNPQDMYSSGPLIVDVDQDGLRDLLMGGVSPLGLPNTGWVRLYKNTSNTHFVDVTATSGLPHTDNYSTAVGDFDGDGDLDLSLTHWDYSDSDLLWQNNGAASFTDVTNQWLSGEANPFTFTASFAQLNDDMHLDLLLASDFGHSHHYHNNGQGLVLQDSSLLTDENGMGASLGDYDNDGDLDWFVTSIYWTAAGTTGNRLYQNNGAGQFVDVSETAGVREGGWGWGSCFADFNNDGWLDIFHVNGYPVAHFFTDRSKLFINNGDGTFMEAAGSYRVDDEGMGRAVLCFDQNRDGKLDILVNNNDQQSLFYQNQITHGNHYLLVKLIGGIDNIDAVGAKLELTLNGVGTQTRYVNIGNNYLSTEPTTQHFGLGSSDVIDSLKITWPDGTVNTHSQVPVDQYLVLHWSEDIFDSNFDGD